MGTSYLFSRRGWCVHDIGEPTDIATNLFFQLWQTRQAPYQTLSETDLVYIGDPRTRRLYWEVQPSHILRDFRYRSHRHALAALTNCYGVLASDLNDYHRTRPREGWLLAWAPVVLRRLDVELPAGMEFGRNGYRRLDEGDRDTLGLPRVGSSRRVLASPPPWYHAGGATSGKVRIVPRYIPVSVRREVIARDGRRCVSCGTTENLHFDHIEPWSLGGPSTVENLRLLCAASNLSKGARRASEPLCGNSPRGRGKY